MTIKLLSALIIALFTACSSEGTKAVKEEKSTITAEVQVKQQTTEELIQKILDLPKWQWVYHPEVEGRLPVKMLKNDLVSDTLKLTKFNQRVQILPMEELVAQKTKAYIEIKVLKLRLDTVDFYIEFPTEGAFANGQFLTKNKEWVIGEYTVGEY
jgi:hypothetical protein